MFRPLLEGHVDGACFDPEVHLPAGVAASTVPLDQARGAGIVEPADRIAAFAGSLPPGALLIEVGDEADVSEPIRISQAGNPGTVSWKRIVIRAGRHSRATVILEHVGSGVMGELVSTDVGEGAHLTLVSVQDWADDAVHGGEHDAHVGRDATYKYVAVTLGGKAVRLSANVRYAGPGGSAELFGVYFADDGQHLEHRSFVDHSAPQCRSHVVYKGALQGATAHTVWVGDVLIRAQAEGTDTYELNRNLVLTEGARADSVPNLEIETGLIEGAGHASATGRFDDEQLFYLQARGIPEDLARRLVVRGFFADIIDQIGVEEIEERLMVAIDAELEGAMSAAPAHTDLEN